MNTTKTVKTYKLIFEKHHYVSVKGLQILIRYKTCPQEIHSFMGAKKIYRLNMSVGSQKGALLLGPEGEKGRDKQN